MILITGSSSGLGAALAKQYASSTTDAQRVAITGRNAQRLAEVAKILPANTISQTCDLCDPQSVSDLLDALPETPKLVIHSAGSGYFGKIEQQDPTTISDMLKNNIESSIFLIREMVKRYKEQPVTIAVIMSTAAQGAKAEESTYCAAKWAVKGFIESVRLELKGHPMKIVAVYPGGMATEFWGTSGKAMDTSSFMTATEAAQMLQQALTSTEHGYISDVTINRG
ncbi:SDR family NAD(P)-dependent oxidoreductase [Vibrio cyclitrophicus]|uniref:SDR family NAD(P)-dependent oxidoreductase n=1 Tax=Vibrio cyclitrophicus ZF270 TaxID=1136176 RepID=A0AAN0LTM0_9VIBR|nr:SDR family NAD(P)-dependent oxidoreductase [Vibrio cyclitrophicus]MBY7659294.1 SDR family NAD(P)-dependent oxidoreductase [Vibrio atlanticus]ERM58476.1 putative short-chain dehydrogenase [Vibrio cyclitrophicus FF75]MBU2931797.1 SDR family NAD(P)-dependent oxidoreductase [Vibrio cyclitrophicus]MCC4772618.1 SDR family NAD(P)-dependent oxidoreductase [Vibrio cyclitrophicus]MCC4843021.1 SDR family NAD(P)-dependent oxidoreductase [Vibrio cyclitrophicus]|tara:strand:+ start:338 stop:1012 length:675 start_codon:yes stop_codon:yes gene_type:complete